MSAIDTGMAALLADGLQLVDVPEATSVELQRCAACGEVFDIDDHAEEDDDDMP